MIPFQYPGEINLQVVFDAFRNNFGQNEYTKKPVDETGLIIKTDL
jgi:hypothetical protein